MFRVLIVCAFLSGCNNSPDSASLKEPVRNLVENNAYGVKKPTVSKYYDEPIVKNVNHYAKWLMQDLFANIDFPSNDEVFVVSDIALLDSGLDATNHFGRQVTEAIMHEVNRTGFSVIDIKTSGFIRMTEQGDLFFQTKDYREMLKKTTATNIITGTMTRHRGGYLINARVIALETRALISSAQIFVPYDVVDAVLKEDTLTSPQGTVEKPISGLPMKSYTKK
jgi:TolB-like protein